MPKQINKYILPNPDGTPGNISFWPLRNRVEAVTKGGKKTTNQNNTCFANVALHLICFVAHSGPLRFVLEDWETIKEHADLRRTEGHFVKLFKKLLIDQGDEGPTIEEVHLGLHELSVNVKELTYSEQQISDKEKTTVTVKVHVISKVPITQGFEDAGEVFMWLAEALHILAGI